MERASGQEDVHSFVTTLSNWAYGRCRLNERIRGAISTNERDKGTVLHTVVSLGREDLSAFTSSCICVSLLIANATRAVRLNFEAPKHQSTKFSFEERALTPAYC